MITNVTIDNFKGLRNFSIDFGDLTLLVGENGVGKSTVLQAISVVKRSIDTLAINTDLPYVNLGALDKLVPPGETGSILVGGIEKTEFRPLGISGIEYSCRVFFDVQGPERYECELRSVQSPSFHITGYWTRYGESRVEPNTLAIGETQFNLQPPRGIGSAFEPGGYNFPSSRDYQTTKRIQETYNSLARLAQVVRTSIQKFSVVPVLRGFLEPAYQLVPNAPLDINPRVGTTQMGGNVASLLAYLDPQAKTLVRQWMKFTAGIDIDWRPIQGAVVTIENPDKGTSFVNEGFGANQLAFIFEEIARGGNGSTIAIEEPEIHLHPEAQFKFGKLAARVASQEGRQLILVTHSEHVVSAILTAVKKHEIDQNKTSIWYLERENGKVMATKSSIDSEGRTEGGLSTFIKTSISELREYADEPQ